MGIRVAMKKAEAPTPAMHELGLGGKKEKVDMILIYFFSKHSSSSTIFLSLLR